jgi:hypothetical protein
MFDATRKGIQERPVAGCAAGQDADALTRSLEGHVMSVHAYAHEGTSAGSAGRT